MAQNGEDMPATDQNDAALPVLAGDATENQAEITMIQAPEAMTTANSANQAPEGAVDDVQMTMPSDTAAVDTYVQETPVATEETFTISADGNDEVGQSASLPLVAPEVSNSPSQDMSSAAAGSAVTMHTDKQPDDRTALDQSNEPATVGNESDIPSTSARLLDQGSEPAALRGDDAEHAQENTVHETANAEQVPVLSEKAADQPQESNIGTTEAVAVVQTTETDVPQPDSDIEEGEELGSPPPAQIQQEVLQQRRTKSPSPGASSRRRDGRSRSPNRERRPSPQRSPIKPPVNRDELFKVYIGGLPERTELVDLQDCFGQFGEIGHIELKLGYAFIVSEACIEPILDFWQANDSDSHWMAHLRSAGIRNTRRCS